MPNYKLQFYDSQHELICLDRFEASDDATAWVIAMVLGDSCSDFQSSFELFAKDRLIYSGHSRSPRSHFAGLPEAARKIVLQRALAIKSGDTRLAMSDKLAKRIAIWQMPRDG
jgi:hypothetical protein